MYFRSLSKVRSYHNDPPIQKPQQAYPVLHHRCHPEKQYTWKAVLVNLSACKRLWVDAALERGPAIARPQYQQSPFALPNLLMFALL